MIGCAAASCVVAALFVSAADARTEHQVQAEGMSFIPAHITAAPGDTVRWVYVSGGFHTVTSGPPCAADNQFFNTGLFDGGPDVVWQVPTDMPDQVIDYFCIPHCPNGMIGTITVEPEVVCPADTNGDEEVDILDLLDLLAAWGTNNDTYDIAPAPNGDGVVNIQDLLVLLSVWGPCT
jgi:plastocyanin